jgi:predicted PurR-regulated permease PerM
MLTGPRQRAEVVILALGVAILIALIPFAIGLLGAAVLYVIFAPLQARLAPAIGKGRAALVVLIVAIVLVLVPAISLLGLLIDQAPETLRSVQESPLLTELARIRIGRFEVGAELAKGSGTILSWISQQAIGFVGSATRTTLNLVIAFFGLYYMLLSAHESWARFQSVIPFSPATTEALRERFHSVTRATLLGTALASVLQGSIVGLAFGAVGLPSPAFWGVITAFASLLPVLGSAFVWLPGVLVLLAQGRYGPAIALAAICGIVASNIDNVVRPLVYRRVSDIHPMVTLVGAFAGLKYFGLLGALLGPLAIVYFFELLHMYRIDYGTVGAGEVPAELAAPESEKGAALPSAPGR